VFLQNYQGRWIFRINELFFYWKIGGIGPRCGGPSPRWLVHESTGSLNESHRFSDLRPRFKTWRGISCSNLGRRLTRGRRQALLLSQVARPRQSSGGAIAGGSGELKCQLQCTKCDEVWPYIEGNSRGKVGDGGAVRLVLGDGEEGLQRCSGFEE
jgi:hypothetical protein